MAGFVAGLDVGTTSVSVVPVTLEGTVLPARSREHRAGIPSEKPWESLQDPGRLLQTAQELLRETAEALGPPEAIGICSQMHGPVYMNERGESLGPLYTWLDGRGNLPASGGPTSGASSRADGAAITPLSYAAHLSEITGLPLSSGFALVTDYVLRMTGELPPGARAIATAGDFVAAALAGRSRPIMDASQAHSFGAYDLAGGGWNLDALAAIGMPAELLPDIAPAGTVIGDWTASPGTPVTTCVGDNQATVLGAAGDVLHDGILSLGTSGQISVHLDDAARAHPAIDVRPFPGSGYLGVGASLTGGKAYQTLRDFFADACMRLGGAGGHGQHHGVDYRALNELAAEELETLEAAGRDLVQDPDLPRVDTRFQGTRTDPGARASISNLTPWNFTPGAIALGLLSGMIEELHQLFSLLPAEVRRDTHRLRLTGNALRRNEVLRRLAGIHFQVPTSVPDYTEEAAVGAAVIAGVGTGVWPSYEAACRTVG